jgi:hypothetical protein
MTTPAGRVNHPDTQAPAHVEGTTPIPQETPRMSQLRLHAPAALIALAAVLVAGCGSTGLVNQWGMPGFSTPIHSVLVIAIKRTESNRRIMEDAFVTELGKRGVKATASYGVFPAALPDTQAVRDYVLANHLEGVLVAARLPAEEQTRSTPGYTTRESRTAYSPWTHRYNTYLVEVEHEGTTVSERVIPHRVDLWYSDHKGGQLVWTALGRSVDPSSASQVSKEMCTVVVSQLAKEGFIARP